MQLNHPAYQQVGHGPNPSSHLVYPWSGMLAICMTQAPKECCHHSAQDIRVELVQVAWTGLPQTHKARRYGR